MAHCYTTQQILKFLYHDLSALEHLEVEYAIHTDPIWKEKHESLKEMIQELPKTQFFPKNRVVRSILAYSTASYWSPIVKAS